MAVQVSDFDRFSFTLFMALAVHAMIVLGITFAPEPPRSSAQTMEITLSQFEDELAPEEADFLAQTNQQGSGSEEQAEEMTTPNPAQVSQQEEAQVQPEPPSKTEPQPVREQQVVQTEAQSSRKIEQPTERTEPVEEPVPVREKKSLMERSLEIASLEARLDAQQQAYARKPRVMRVTAASTLKSTNAWYVQNWISKVTRVGNINYPTEARRAGIYGTLRMLVSLRKDGTIKEVAVLQSSGSTVLDDAAIRIVRMASPFAPFPDSMGKKVDELEIIRTWSFQRRGADFRMTASKHSPNSLRHHFLVASPYLADPRFHGAVIYLCEHSDDGALGLMINQPLDIHLGEILEQLDMHGGELDLPVYSGGPVEPERGFVLHPPGTSWQNTAEVTDDVLLTTSRDILAGIGQNQGPEEFLVALGYAGWSEGQLEQELGSNSWLTCPASTDIIFRTPWEDRYKAVLKLIGIDLNQLSESIGHA